MARRPFLGVPLVAIVELQPNEMAVIADVAVADPRFPRKTIDLQLDVLALRQRDVQTDIQPPPADVFEQSVSETVRPFWSA